MIRVAVICGKMDSGGKKSLIMEYYRHIDRTKIQFDFICDSDSNSIPREEIESMGGRVYEIAPYQYIFQNMRDMKKLFKANKYPIMHAYNSTMNVFPLAVAKYCKIPVRISESLSMAHKDEGKTLLKKLLRPLSGLFANCFLACGVDCGIWQFGKDRYYQGNVKIFKTCINTDFNDYDPELRKRTRERFGWEDKIVIGHIGRFVPQKNPLKILSITAQLIKDDPNVVLCLIGDGYLKDEMEAKIDELGIRDHICYLGRREDIQQFYNAMDGFLLPSLYEGLPVVGLEAECCGLPVFFSTEITKEASACELGVFLGLDAPDELWSRTILEHVRKNIPKRTGRKSDVIFHGFDSRNEAKKLQEYYLDRLEELQND